MLQARSPNRCLPSRFERIPRCLPFRNVLPNNPAMDGFFFLGVKFGFALAVVGDGFLESDHELASMREDYNGTQVS